MKKIIIFDMDGVIIDTEPAYEKILLDFFRDSEYHITGIDYKDLVGGNFDMTFNILNQRYPEFFKDRVAMVEAFKEYNRVHPVDYGKLGMANLIPTLEGLKARDYRLAVASSGEYGHILKNLKSLYADSYFEFIVSGYDFKQSKPHPAIYNFCADKFNVPANDIYVIEDSNYGIVSAKNAGMVVIAKRDCNYDFDQSLADYFIDDLLEILTIVKE